jgi:hypothetical protein
MKHSCLQCKKEFIKKGNLDRHILTTHNQKRYDCKTCNKQYSHISSLSRHSKTCKMIPIEENQLVKYNTNNSVEQFKRVYDDHKDKITEEQYNKIITIIKNADKEVLQNGITVNINNSNNSNNNIINNVTNTVTNIDKFHIDIFLNDTCKNAINMSDFMKSIQPTYNDIQNCHQEGIIQTISNTVLSRLKDLELEKRPIHCSDKKRKTIYIRDNNNWNKDINHNLIKKVIDEISYKQVRALQEWISTTHEQMSSEEFTNKLMEITRNLTDDLSLNKCYTKIIGNISESVFI